MKKKKNWWWVVATHERGTVRRKEAIAMRMIIFMEHHAAACVFNGKSNAEAWLKVVKQKNLVPEGITLQILNNVAWHFARDMYYKGRRFEQGQL